MHGLHEGRASGACAVLNAGADGRSSRQEYRDKSSCNCVTNPHTKKPFLELQTELFSISMTCSEGFRYLKVYKLAFGLAMEIFHESRRFPAEETYSLTDQIRRASRSVPGNIGEGYRKKQYPKMFISKMADADGEATETQIWLDFARECGYISEARQLELKKGYEEVGRMLGGMMAHPERFSK